MNKKTTTEKNPSKTVLKKIQAEQEREAKLQAKIERVTAVKAEANGPVTEAFKSFKTYYKGEIDTILGLSSVRVYKILRKHNMPRNTDASYAAKDLRTLVKVREKRKEEKVGIKKPKAA